MSGLVELGFCEKKSFCALQKLLAARAAFGSAFYSSHFIFSSAEAQRIPEHRGKFPRTGTGTQSESESVSTACLEAQQECRVSRNSCEHWPGPPSVWTGPLAGRPTVAGCALPGAAKSKNLLCGSDLQVRH